ncbi:MAG: GGDEF domain-containing protein [Desulfobacterales bacterium]|nr:GGDEF domain-containing protein [Desulfobacterales bacterium]
MATQSDERNALLQEQISKLQSQKDKLLKELDEMEERFDRTERLYRRYFPLILDVMAQEETAFAKACGELGNCLKKDTSPAKLAYVFEKLKTAIIKEDKGAIVPKKKKGMFASLLRSSSNDFVDTFRKDYNEVLNQLRSTMDNKYKVQLDAIGSSILSAEDSRDIAHTRETLFDLIFRYINETNTDRGKVNAFIKEIVAKILEIEKKMASSYSHANSIFESQKGFEDVLTMEMEKIKETTNVAANLDDLKSQITQRLSSIDLALNKKHMTDKVIREASQKHSESFKSGLAKLKKELNAATRYTEELEKKLNKDQLTGAFNRRAYDLKMEDEMARFKRYGTHFSLLLIDADHFKRINDNYGHAVGDKCLKEIIQRTMPLLRKNDMLARYGGEEFAVIMPGTDIKGAQEAADKIRRHIEQIAFLYKEEKVQVTVSIGVSQVLESDETHKDLFERVDVAVYKAKENGRNRVEAQ